MTPPIERAKEFVRGDVKVVIVAALPQVTVLFYLADLTSAQLKDATVPDGVPRFHYEYERMSEIDVVACLREIRKQWPGVPIYRQRILERDILELWRG